MLFVDFYRLAILHNQSRNHAGNPSDPSHPPYMGPITRSQARLLAANSDQPTPLLPLSTLPVPQTPRRRRDATRFAPGLTPKSHGTSLFQKQIHASEPSQKYNSSKYEEYIIQDFERHRIFVDMEVFMKYVLLVPDNWKELWGGTIEEIKRDTTFWIAYSEYIRECKITGADETRFYEPLVDMSNAILDFSSRRESDDSVKPRTPQRYMRNDPRRATGGVIGGLSPDIVAVHKEVLPRLPVEGHIAWAQALQALEVKPSDGALIDGSCIPRLIVDGEQASISRDDIF
jgi:hypothetical protein